MYLMELNAKSLREISDASIDSDKLNKALEKIHKEVSHAATLGHTEIEHCEEYSSALKDRLLQTLEFRGFDARCFVAKNGITTWITIKW